MTQKSLRILFFLATAAVLTSCGGENTGNLVTFQTVNATATVESSKNPLLADLATWNGTPCGATSTFSIKNDVVNFTLSTVANIKNGTSSPLVLNKATIVFTPADTSSPALSTLFTPAFQPLGGYTVPAGGTLTVPIEVVTHSLKEFFIPTLVCTGNASIYSYNVTITFDAVEVNTGKAASIPASMVVRFADFAD